MLRFDDIDVASDTNELEYGVTQRLFLRPVKARPCMEKGRPGRCRARTWGWIEGRYELQDNRGRFDPRIAARLWQPRLISWRLTQKYFFDENFGGAVVNGRRNIFDTTLNFSGIAFLTEPRAISPLISRLRVRTSSHMDVEWDFDLDTGAKKFTSNNVLRGRARGQRFCRAELCAAERSGAFLHRGSHFAPSRTSTSCAFCWGMGRRPKPGWAWRRM